MEKLSSLIWLDTPEYFVNFLAHISWCISALIRKGRRWTRLWRPLLLHEPRAASLHVVSNLKTLALLDSCLGLLLEVKRVRPVAFLCVCFLKHRRILSFTACCNIRGGSRLLCLLTCRCRLPSSKKVLATRMLSFCRHCPTRVASSQNTAPRSC